MKHFLFLGGIMLGLALISVGQITINRSDLGNFAGLTIIEGNDTTNLNLLSPGGAGINQIWDLTGIGNDYLDTTQFISPAEAPYSSNFPTATLAGTDGSMFFYIHDDNNSFEILGICGVFLPPDTSVVPFTPPQKQATFPSTYNTSFSGQTKIIVQFPNNPPPPDSVRIIQTTNYTSLIDGWGNVTTPTGTYSCLRQKYTEYQIDSTFIYISGFGWQSAGTPTLDTTIEYRWWSQNSLFIATISTDGSANIKDAIYLILSTIGINEIQNISLVSSVFPNPASESVTIINNNPEAKTLTIVDVLGKKISETFISSTQVKLSCKNFNKGLYFYHIRDANGKMINSGKFLVK